MFGLTPLQKTLNNNIFLSIKAQANIVALIASAPCLMLQEARKEPQKKLDRRNLLCPLKPTNFTRSPSRRS